MDDKWDMLCPRQVNYSYLFFFFDPALNLVQNYAWTAWYSLDSESCDKTK